jgi:hypothetical protein
MESKIKITSTLERFIKLLYLYLEVLNLGKSRLRNRTPVGSAIDNELYRELKEYSLETGIPVSKLLDKAIKLYLETIKQKPNKYL